YDDDRAMLAIDAAHVENVRPVLEVGSIRFLVIDWSEAARARKQDPRQSLDLDVAVIPLKHRANVDDAVDVRAPWRESANRRTRRLCEKIGECAQTCFAGIGKRVDAPRAVGARGVAELHRLRVGNAHDGRGVDAHGDDESLREVLEGSL